MKIINLRDGPLVDGAPSRVPYQMAEMSDLPAAHIPIVAPARPDLVFTGPAGSSMPQVTNLDTWQEGYDDTGSVTFAYRALVDTAAATGWDFISVPNIAGFRPPRIVVAGTYRNTGNPSATQPRAPYMGNEANHWSSTQRIYIGQYNQKTGTGRYYVAVTVTYTRR